MGIEKKDDITEAGASSRGPCTLIEGFLQLRNPIMVEKPPKPKCRSRRSVGSVGEVVRSKIIAQKFLYKCHYIRHPFRI